MFQEWFGLERGFLADLQVLIYLFLCILDPSFLGGLQSRSWGCVCNAGQEILLLFRWLPGQLKLSLNGLVLGLRLGSLRAGLGENELLLLPGGLGFLLPLRLLVVDLIPRQLLGRLLYPLRPLYPGDVVDIGKILPLALADWWVTSLALDYFRVRDHLFMALGLQLVAWL